MLLAYADPTLKAAVVSLHRAGAHSREAAGALRELLTLIGTFRHLGALTAFGVVVTHLTDASLPQVLRLEYFGVAITMEPVMEPPETTISSPHSRTAEIEKARVTNIEIDGVQLGSTNVERPRGAVIRSASS